MNKLVAAFTMKQFTYMIYTFKEPRAKKLYELKILAILATFQSFTISKQVPNNELSLKFSTDRVMYLYLTATKTQKRDKPDIQMAFEHKHGPNKEIFCSIFERVPFHRRYLCNGNAQGQRHIVTCLCFLY